MTINRNLSLLTPNVSVTGTVNNAGLSNSSLTFGSTTISLGASSNTLAGLTSVTSTSFIGELTGNATNITANLDASKITTGVFSTDRLPAVSYNSLTDKPTLGTAASANSVDFAETARGLPAGGTAGQALVKLSSTNYDDAWATIFSGGLTNIQVVSSMPGSPLANTLYIVTG
jgi:hypothetical protein